MIPIKRPPKFGGIRHVGDLMGDGAGNTTAVQRIADITDPIDEMQRPEDRIEKFDRQQGG